ncbi:type II secretion system protein GspM [Roseobacter sp. A03A-229]
MRRPLLPRERRLLMLCGALMVAWVVGGLLILPLLNSRADSIARIAKADAISTLLATSADLKSPAAAAEPLATLLTRRAAATNISIRRLDPSEGAISVTLGDTPYHAVIGWIATLAGEDGLRVASLEMARLTAPGMVSARMVLEAAP